MTAKLDAVDKALLELNDQIQNCDSDCEKKEKEGSATADDMAELRAKIALCLKGFHTTNYPTNDVTSKLQDVGSWIAKTMKSINEPGKAAAKTAAGKAMGKLAASSPLEALAEKLAKELRWFYSLKSKTPCMFDQQRAKSWNEAVAGLEYYKLPKRPGA